MEKIPKRTFSPAEVAEQAKKMKKLNGIVLDETGSPLGVRSDDDKLEPLSKLTPEERAFFEARFGNGGKPPTSH